MLMADFILSATTINFDGLSSLWLRNVTTYVLATAGAKIAKKGQQSKGGSGRYWNTRLTPSLKLGLGRRRVLRRSQRKHFGTTRQTTKAVRKSPQRSL